MDNNATVNPLFRPGDSVGRYRVEAFLGQGAFGQVYHVTHLGLNAPRAVKLLRRDMPGVGSSDTMIAASVLNWKRNSTAWCRISRRLWIWDWHKHERIRRNACG